MHNNNLKIFLVDDDRFCIDLYKQHLESIGYSDISTFDNGVDCLGSLDRLPDIIFLDQGMDHLTGMEVLPKIRAVLPHAFVIFLSGQTNIITAVKALKAGAFDYIVKGSNETKGITKVLIKISDVIELRKNVEKELY